MSRSGYFSILPSKGTGSRTRSRESRPSRPPRTLRDLEERHSFCRGASERGGLGGPVEAPHVYKGPNAGGGTRRFEAASYAEAIFRSTSSLPGSARNTNEKGNPGSGMTVGVSEGTVT